jgi:hypothetical protein
VPPDLAAEPLRTARLDLEPLRVEHAAEAAPLFADERLHTFTGGAPAGEAALRELVGTVQATVTHDAADVAWVVAVPHQGRGFAREGALAMADWLCAQGIASLTAHVHPDHAASAAVALAIGLAPTRTVVDGEIRWAGA